MHIDYEISEDDYMLAQRLAIKRSRSWFNRGIFSFLPWLGVFLLVFIAFTILRQGVSQNILPGLIVPLFLISLPILTRRNIRKLYRNSANLHGPLSLDAEDDGLAFRGPTFSSRVTWAHYSRHCEDDHSFVLFQNPRVFNIIPKRTLSPEQIAALRGLLKLRIAARG